MRGPNTHSLIPPHLKDAQLLAYVDGELPHPEMELARLHVEGCWTCRSRMGEIQGTIGRFLEGRVALLPKESTFSENRVQQFAERLAQHAGEMESAPVPLQERFQVWRNRAGLMVSSLLAHRRALIASVVSVCLLVVMFTDVLNTRVSADTVLLHAESYEATHAPAGGQVAKTALRIDRIDRTRNVSRQLGTVTLIHDSAGGATFMTAQSTTGAVERKALSTTEPISHPLLSTIMTDSDENRGLINYLNSEQWVPDLSVGQFRRLVETRGSTEVKASRNDGTFELHYPFAPGHPSGIYETMLQVDAKDYSPTSLSIFTGNHGDNEYRFTRTSFSIEPRTLEMARIFEPAEGFTNIPGVARTLPQVSRPVPLSYRNSRASDQEVAVSRALHKLDSCLGEELYVFPMSDGSVLVQGLVDNPARRDAVRRGLKSVAGPLRAEIYLPREIKSGSELYKPPDDFAQETSPIRGSATDTLADLSGTSVPLHDMLYQHFFKPGASAEDTNKQAALFSDEIVTLARQAFLHAWALKRLDREFSEQRSSGLSSAGMQIVEQMREDHRRWIATITKREAEMLVPLAAPDVTADVQQLNLQDDSTVLLQLAREQNDLVHFLFTISPQKSAAGPSLSRLIVVLKQMGT